MILYQEKIEQSQKCSILEQKKRSFFLNRKDSCLKNFLRKGLKRG
jgi:hypothetical protein